MSFGQFAFKIVQYSNPAFWIKHYFYESIFLISLILFIQILIYGSKKNMRIAKFHFQSISVELGKYFKNVGDNKRGELFEKDNPHSFKMYASNHPVMKFCLVGIYVRIFTNQLSKRENMFIYYGYDFIFPFKERLVIEIGVQPQFRQFICFGVVKQNQIQRIKKEGYEDLKNLCKIVQFPQLSNDLQVLSEYDDIAQQIFTEEIIQLLNANQKLIHIIYVSDVDRDPSCKICVKIMANLQSEIDYPKLVQLAIALSLQVSSIKMDNKKINKSIQTRRKFNSKFKD